MGTQSHIAKWGTNHPQAVDVAKGAALYLERSQGKVLYRAAAFARDERKASLAETLLELQVSIKGTLIYDGTGARVPKEWTAKTVLECYARFGLTGDFRAHCYTIIADPFVLRRYLRGEAWERYVLPCRLIDRFKLRLAWEHPSGTVDQVEAAGVDSGCHWCPHFDAEAFRRAWETGLTPRESRDLDRLLRDVDLEL